MPASARPRRRLARVLSAQAGQASVELVALLPVIALLAALAWQAALVGQAVWLAGSAARAAARSAAIGVVAREAALRVLPDRLETGLKVRGIADGGVRLTVRVPAVLGRRGLGSVSASARLQPQEAR